MHTNTIIIIGVLFCSHCIVGIIGFGLSYFMHSRIYYGMASAKKPDSFLRKENTQQTNINIDDKKIVMKISTDDLQKKYEQIAETTETKSDISGSVNKLKNLRGK